MMNPDPSFSMREFVLRLPDLLDSDAMARSEPGGRAACERSEEERAALGVVATLVRLHGRPPRARTLAPPRGMNSLRCSVAETRRLLRERLALALLDGGLSHLKAAIGDEIYVTGALSRATRPNHAEAGGTDLDKLMQCLGLSARAHGIDPWVLAVLDEVHPGTRAGSLRAAGTHLEAAASLLPGFEPISFYRVLCRTASAPARAIRSWSDLAASSRQPESIAFGLQGCGRGHLDLGRPHLALRCFDQAARLLPGSAMQAFNGMLAASLLGDEHAALERCSRFTRLFPDTADATAGYQLAIRTQRTLWLSICRDRQRIVIRLLRHLPSALGRLVEEWLP